MAQKNAPTIDLTTEDDQAARPVLYCLQILTSILFKCVGLQSSIFSGEKNSSDEGTRFALAKNDLKTTNLANSFTDAQSNSLLWLAVEDSIRIFAIIPAQENGLRSDVRLEWQVLLLLLELQKRLQISSTKCPIYEELKVTGDDQTTIVACSTLIGSSGYVSNNGSNTSSSSAISPKTFMTHLQVLVVILISKLSPESLARLLTSDEQKILLNIVKNVWDCCIMFDRAKGSIYPMRSGKRIAVINAIRRVVSAALTRTAQDLTIWTYLLSAYLSIHGGLQAKAVAPATSDATASAPLSLKMRVGPVTGLKALRFSVELPLEQNDPLLKRLFDPIATPAKSPFNTSAELTYALEVVNILLPHMVRATHDVEFYADDELGYLVIVLTEFCAYIGPHKNLIYAFDKLNNELGGSISKDAQLQELLALNVKFDLSLDVIHGGLMFVMKWLAERIHLWASDGSQLGLSFRPQERTEKLPVTTASFYALPVSLERLKTWQPGMGSAATVISAQQQRRVAFRIFGSSGDMMFNQGGTAASSALVGCRDFSGCLYQILVLSLNLSVSLIADSVRQELCTLLQLIGSQQGLSFGSASVMRFKNQANSIIPNINPVTDCELYQAVNVFQKYLIEHSGLLLAIEQRFNIWKCLQNNINIEGASAQPLTHIEFFMTPISLGKRFWWFLKSLIPALDLAAEDENSNATVKTTSSPLLGIERAIWDVFIHALKVGPIIPRSNVVLDSSSGASFRKNVFDAHDIYLAFFGFVETFLKHANKHVTQYNELKTANAQAAESPSFYADATKLHGLVCSSQNAWLDLFLKWSKPGQHIAGQQAQSGNWTDSELGLKIRESAVYIYHLIKGLKMAVSQDLAKTMWLSKEILSIMQGQLLGSAPTSTSSDITAASSATGKKKQSDKFNSLSAHPPTSSSAATSQGERLLNFDKELQNGMSSSAGPTSSTHSSGSGVGVNKRPLKESRDLAKELMNQWKQKPPLHAGGPTALQINDEATLAKEPMWRRNVLTGKSSISTNLTDAAPSRETIIVGPGGKPIPKADAAAAAAAAAKKNEAPQLKKITPDERKKLAVDAKAGVQKVLLEILEWDMFNLENYQPLELQDFPSKLPVTFPSKDIFRKYFSPLVLEECRCSMLQERMERRLEAFPLLITSASLSAGWMLLGARSAKLRAARDGTARPPPDQESVIENASPYELEMLPFRLHDLLLLIPCETLLNPVSPFEGRTFKEIIEMGGGCSAAGGPRWPHFLAVLEKREDDASSTSSAPNSSIPSNLRDQIQCFLRLPRSGTTGGGSGAASRINSTNVAIGSKWVAYSLASLTTSVREFQSLFMSAFSPVFDFILHPSVYLQRPPGHQPSAQGNRKRNQGPGTAPGNVHKKPTPPYIESLKTKNNLNVSQTLAVKHAVTADFGVALLQGPPGTGKTKTLLSILSAIFLQRIVDTPAGRKAAISFDENSSTNEAPSGSRGKILVCAPSNAAVDEIACRVLRDGLIGPHGQTFRPKCFRVGNPNRITRDAVREISLEALLSRENAEVKNEKKEAMEKGIEKIGETMQKLEQKLLQLQAEGVVAGPIYGELKAQQRNLYNQRKKLRESLSDDVKGAQKSHKDGILKAADIIFATLSGSASEILTGLSSTVASSSGSGSSTSAFFEYVVIDEAAQAVELSTLIPLRHDVEKLVLIGDPQQLPATVLSSSAKKFNYERSLFQRLEQCGVEVVMLDTQYRMRVEISAFPSKHFYRNKLIDDPISVQQRPLAAWSAKMPAILGPLKFFHLPSKEDRGHTQSLYNTSEATFIVELICFVLKRFGRRRAANTSAGGVALRDVAVLTPYKQQVLEIQRLLRMKNSFFSQFEVGEQEGAVQQPGNSSFNETLEIEVCTIDSFQGREKPIILFSCVRSLATGTEADVGSVVPPPVSEEEEFGSFFGRPQKRVRSDASVNIGFVADIRRLNVAITRARESLWIVGNALTLSNHETWKALVQHAQRSNEAAKIKSHQSSQAAPPWAAPAPAAPNLLDVLKAGSFVDVPATCKAFGRNLTGGYAATVGEFFYLCETQLAL